MYARMAQKSSVDKEHRNTRITKIEIATLSLNAMTAHQRAHTANHRISRTHDAVDEREITIRHVIELELHHAIIRIDRGDE